MLYMVTFTINILQMLAYISYIDPQFIYLFYGLSRRANAPVFTVSRQLSPTVNGGFSSLIDNI